MIHEFKSLLSVSVEWMWGKLLICNQMSHEGETTCCFDWFNDCHHLLCRLLPLSFWMTFRRGFALKLHLWECVLECSCNNDYCGLWRFLSKNYSWLIYRSLYLFDRCFNCVFVCCVHLSYSKINTSRGENILIAS